MATSNVKNKKRVDERFEQNRFPIDSQFILK